MHMLIFANHSFASICIFMTIKNKIQEDLKAAMKSGDSFRRDVLRLLDSAIKNVEIEKKKREEGLSEEEVIEVISRAVKQRQDSIKQYNDGGRGDLAEKEQKELDIIMEYMPEQLSEDEIEKIVAETISQVGVLSPADMGKVMSMVMAKLKGKADGNVVRDIVQKKLAAK